MAALSDSADLRATADTRPPIWVEGRQAPAFDAQAFLQAGILLTRDQSSRALVVLAARAQDLGARTPTSRTGAALTRASAWSHTARHLLFPTAPKPAPAPAWAAAHPLPRQPAPAPAPAAPTDPDLAAIRAVLNTAPIRRDPALLPSPSPHGAHRAATLRFLDWLAARVLAGTVLALASPLGFGQALYRHFEGQDLREIAEDCLQKTAQ